MPANPLILPVALWCALAPVPQAEEPEAGREYLLERIGDAAVVQIYADGFEGLPLEEKLLAWHLYQAALAGRDIYYDQRSAHALEMRAVLEAVLTHGAHVEADTLAEIRRYTKLFWINSGPYNHLTARKFVLECPPDAFLAAVNAAAEDGAEFPTGPGESLDAMVGRLGPMFFDPAFEPIVTNKSPGPGGDILLDSANNLYVDVSSKDLAGFEEAYPLNSRLVKRPDGTLVEEPYRIGGRYSEQIRRIIEHLKDASAVAPGPTAEALLALVTYYESGTVEDRKAYDIAWVRDADASVDTINGFTEVYMDARGVKGSWESAVFYVNEEKTADIKKIAAEAQWFEDRMPWAPDYRKPDVQGITANAIEVVIETGDCGPVTPIGINLPNDQEVREQYGSKSVSLSNVIEAYAESTPTAFHAEFSWTGEEAARAEEWGGLSKELLVNMHEVIGHASGRVSDALEGQPQDAIKEYYSALEEGRADLIALYFMADPRLAELGLVAAEDQPEMARAAFEDYTRNALVQLRRVPEGAQIEEDHMRNRQMVVRWLIDNTEAIEVRERDGKTYYVMVDPEAFRAGVGTLLAEVQRIKSEGDYAAAKALFDTYGITFDPDLRDQVVSRVEALDLPSYTGFVMPRLEPEYGDDGEIVDVAISYPRDLEAQMLEYSSFGSE
ncbi:dipeptidyl-peptidase 3 family protein [Tautonia plasticadhaerens]|uniref:Peptidase family M49 n=1 Tax=Tautonia plasticadhaerens TaxID=2527974 RepID=A0A518H4V0_9BACT|nr:peptidase M49 [Tautonia plasticadhaerens]QDV35876.1 Peptidase family M49 [Tautonia plasticadhaerens]